VAALQEQVLTFSGWWAAFRSYTGPMLDKSCDQMNNWRLDNPRAFSDQVERSNVHSTSYAKVKHTSESFSS